MAWELADNIRGPKGDKGDPGTVSSASAATIPPGQPAKVTLTGTTDVHMHLDIPQGEPGPQGPPGVASSASAEAVAYGQAPEVILSQEGELVHARFKIPGGAPGVNAVPTEEAVGAYLSTPASPTRPGLKTGMAQVADDPASDFAVGQANRLAAGLAPKAEKTYVDSADASTLTSAKTYADGKATGAVTTANGYTDGKVAPVQAAVTALAGSAATVDELIFSMRIDCNYSGTTAVVEFSSSSAFTLLVVPFAMEIVDVVLSFERYNLAANNTDYVRAWAQKLVNGVSTPMTATKTTQATAPGEAIVARRAWSLTGAGISGNPLAAGDLLQIVMGVTGAPANIQLPVTVTVKYRPI